MMSDARSNLRDVAREAGVSHMTVSRVVRGRDRVAEVTRRRVEAAIRRLDYRPDPALSALASYRTRAGGARGSSLAFLFCDEDNYSRSVLAGVRAEAERLGYGVETHSPGRAASSQRRLARILFHRGIRGLLFGPAQSPYIFDGWDWHHFAPVSLGAVAHQPAMNSVAMDYFDGILRAISKLRSLGVRKVGLAVDPALESRTGHRWLGGFLAQNLTKPMAVFTGDPANRNGLLRWFRRERPDGVLTIHRPVWQQLQPRGVKCVFLNAFDCPAGVPHVSLDPDRIGREGVRLLHHQILNREFGLTSEIKTISLQGEIRDY